MPTRSLLAIVVLTGAGLTQPGPSAGALDVAIRHGTVLDGSGRAGFIADVGISSGHIVAIGDLGAAKAATEIEARGLYVTPGFIRTSPRSCSEADKRITSLL
jgi:urease alpha subunit